MDRIEVLQTIPLFESLEAEDLTALAERLREHTVESGQDVFAQGDEGDAMYVIVDGAIEIIATSKQQQKVTLVTLYKGQYFGELSLLDGAPRSATARATRETQMLALERDDFVAFVRTRPDVALSVMHEVGERMRATNELMTLTVSRNVLEEEEERLSFGDRVADKVASFGGSWPFIFVFGGFMVVWMLWNTLASEPIAFDPLPFMFLNLFLSTIAALQAPVIMMSQNRQSVKDKALAMNDFQVNLKNEVSIDKLIRGQAELLQRLGHLEHRIAAMSGRPSVESIPR
jgi:uncharacterized membrane protein